MSTEKILLKNKTNFTIGQNYFNTSPIRDGNDLTYYSDAKTKDPEVILGVQFYNLPDIKKSFFEVGKSMKLNNIKNNGQIQYFIDLYQGWLDETFWFIMTNIEEVVGCMGAKRGNPRWLSELENKLKNVAPYFFLKSTKKTIDNPDPETNNYKPLIYQSSTIYLQLKYNIDEFGVGLYKIKPNTLFFDVWNDYGKDINAFLAAVRSKYGKISYIKALDVSDDWTPVISFVIDLHDHIPKSEDIDHIKSLWKYGDINVDIDISPYEAFEKIKNQILEPPVGHAYTKHAILWLLGKKEYHISSDLQSHPTPNSDVDEDNVDGGNIEMYEGCEECNMMTSSPKKWYYLGVCTILLDYETPTDITIDLTPYKEQIFKYFDFKPPT